MANVKFLRGSQAQLPTSGSNDVVDGALYFAINQQDSGQERGKLYLGDENHNLVPIGEDIVLKVVSSISNLPDPTKHNGEFYYCTTGNILAFSDGTAPWKQVNTNTTLDSTIDLLNVVFGTNAATLNFHVADTGTSDITDSVIIKGGTNVTVANNSGIEISAVDTTYGIGAASGTKSITREGSSVSVPKADVNLTSTKANDNSSFEIYSPNETVTVGVSSGAITLDVNGAKLSGINAFAGASGQVNADGTAKSGAAATQGFHHNITLGTGDILGANIDPQISYRTNLISDGAATYSTPVHFENGVAQLPVYSASAVEARITQLENTIDAMEYRGGIASKAALDQLANNNGLHNGDVFVATSDFGSSNLVDSQLVNEGYLIIVQGTENADGVITGTPSYVVIKANDTDTTYGVTGITNGLQFTENQSGTSNTIGSISVAGGTAITVSDSGTTSKVVTVTHSNVSHSTTTGTAQTTNAGTDISFTAVTGITVNDQGHVTAIETSSLSAEANDIDTDAFTVTAVSGSDAVKVRHVITMDSGTATSADLELSSSGETIAITRVDNDTVNFDIVWGTFGS